MMQTDHHQNDAANVTPDQIGRLNKTQTGSKRRVAKEIKQNQRSNARRNNFKRSVGPSRRKRPTSSYRGVTWNKWHQKWTSQIRYNGKQHHLGVFVDPIAAAKTYDQAALKYHAAKAVLNFPEEARANAEQAKEKADENSAMATSDGTSSSQLEVPPMHHTKSRQLGFLQATQEGSAAVEEENGRNAAERRSDAEVMARKRSRVDVIQPSGTMMLVSDPQEDYRQRQLQQTLQFLNGGMLCRNKTGGLLPPQLSDESSDDSLPLHTSSLLHSSYAYTGGSSTDSGDSD